MKLHYLLTIRIILLPPPEYIFQQPDSMRSSQVVVRSNAVMQFSSSLVQATEYLQDPLESKAEIVSQCMQLGMPYKVRTPLVN